MSDSGAAFENIWFVGEFIREIWFRGSQRLTSRMFDNDPKCFYVILFSNAFQIAYPNNTIDSFAVDLPQPIELGPNDN